MTTVHRFTNPAYADLRVKMRRGEHRALLFDRLHALGLVVLRETPNRRAGSVLVIPCTRTDKTITRAFDMNHPGRTASGNDVPTHGNYVLNPDTSVSAEIPGPRPIPGPYRFCPGWLRGWILGQVSGLSAELERSCPVRWYTSSRTSPREAARLALSR